MTRLPAPHHRGLAAAGNLLVACVCLGTWGGPALARGQAVAAPPVPASAPAPLDLRRFEKDVAAFEQADRTSPPPQGGILFVGSSIFRQWTGLQAHMAPLSVFNRAFGGSRTAEQLHYLDRIVLPYRPRVIVYYCGSNDVNANETAEMIAGNYETFSERVRVALPGTRVYFASIIKAPQKRDRWDVVEAANARVRAYSARTPGRGYIDLHPALETAPGQPRMDLYLPDRLHYLPPAYDRMAAVVRPVIEQAWAEVKDSPPLPGR
jgi:lysophospholipase L1-like esterase